jgi:hypothetical protein
VKSTSRLWVNTYPSVNDKYGAKDKAIRFRHRLAEAIVSVGYAGLDLSHLTKQRATHGHQRPPNADRAVGTANGDRPDQR